jgi:hypothetical protein
MARGIVLALVVGIVSGDVISMPMKKLSNHEFAKQRRSGRVNKPVVVGDTGSVRLTPSWSRTGQATFQAPYWTMLASPSSRRIT